MYLNPQAGDVFDISVKVLDVFMGQAVINHRITKVAVPLPTVFLRPAGILVLADGSVNVYPNTM